MLDFLIRYVNKYTLSYDFNERLIELYNLRKKYFMEELIQWLSPTLLDRTKISENILKNTRVIYEKISKNNISFFEKTYPHYLNSVTEDKGNPNFLTLKFYVNKF